MPVITLNKTNSVTRDTYVSEYYSTAAYGGNTRFYIGTGDALGKRNRAFIIFDLGLIPNNAIINSATLSIYGNAGYNKQVDIHKLTGAWDDTTTWNTHPSFDPTPSASFTRAAAAGSISVDITTLVREWVNGALNYGLLLKNTDESLLSSNDGYNSFDDSSNQPTLTIDYTVPPTGGKQVQHIKTQSATNYNTTTLTLSIPAEAQTGDLMIVRVAVGSSVVMPVPPGWTVLENLTGSNMARTIYVYRYKQPGDTSVTFSPGTAFSSYGTISIFRNVKSIASYSTVVGSTSPIQAAEVTGAPLNSLVLLLYGQESTATFSTPLSFKTLFSNSVSNGTFSKSLFAAQRYLYQKTTLTQSEMAVTSSTSGTITVATRIVLEPITNRMPTISLTSPTNNQTLSEGNTLPVEGTAGDTDNGNVVTVKYKINNGPTRAIASGVSDGSSPISFARTLTYSNKRLWDGSTDIVGADLAEGVDHTLTVWAEDDQGGKSAEVTRKFRVIWNRPPSISGANEDLGTIMVPPSKAYTVTEPEGNPFTITEKINGNVIRSFEGVAGREETVTIPHDLWIRLDLDTPHSLTVEATDSKGLTSTRTFTFTRKETHIEFMLDFDNPDVEAHFTLDGMPKRVLVTLERYLPPGSSVEFVRVCNNAMDQTPTWEDATAAVTAGRGYLFTNQEKTAENWRINIWVCIAKGTATERVRLDGYGGAFD
jgi:hypothetical protein